MRVVPKPERSPSLQNYPRCDEEVRTLAKELWGDSDGAKITEHKLGAGRIVWGRPVGEKILRSDYDGWIMGRTHGIVHYPGIEVCGMGVRDDLPTVLPHAKGYFKS